jgi:hypothetical protein
MTTARDICTGALELDGIIAANEAGAPEDLDLCLRRLNGMLSSWSINRNNILATVIETFPLVLNQASYTIGAGGNFNTVVPTKIEESSFIQYQGVDYILKSLDEDQYSQIPYKANGGIPYAFWLDPDPILATIYFYPVPQSNQTLQMHSVKPFTAFADLDTVYNFAPGYEEAWTYSLAERIAPAFEREVPKFVAVEAIKLRRSLKRSNIVIPTMNIDFVPAGIIQDPIDWRYQ